MLTYRTVCTRFVLEIIVLSFGMQFQMLRNVLEMRKIANDVNAIPVGSAVPPGIVRRKI